MHSLLSLLNLLMYWLWIFFSKLLHEGGEPVSFPRVGDFHDNPLSCRQSRLDDNDGNNIDHSDDNDGLENLAERHNNNRSHHNDDNDHHHNDNAGSTELVLFSLCAVPGSTVSRRFRYVVRPECCYSRHKCR